MSILSDDKIVKVLYSFNPWWKTGMVDGHYNKPKQRLTFYDVKKSFLHETIRRAVLLSGARRTGKTTIMYQMINLLLTEYKIDPKKIIFITFDHSLFKINSIERILEVYKQTISNDEEVYCFFDEIQYASDWESWIKILMDNRPKIRILATGSASPILNDKINNESGLGRWRITPVPTLSFYEYCDLLDIPKPNIPNVKPTQLYKLPIEEQTEIVMKVGELQSHFIRYLHVGGFPELALSKDDMYAQRILREDIVDKALKRDLPAMYGVRNILDVERIFLYLCYHSSDIISIDTVAKELKGASKPTVEKYIMQLESANLIYVSSPIELSGKKILKKQDKIYISDAAMRNAVLMDDELMTNPEELGKIVETTVFRHIKAFYYNSAVRIGYYRESGQGKEIDIVIKMPNFTNIMMEVKYRENTKFKLSDPIVSLSTLQMPGIVITKQLDDFGLEVFQDDKSIYRIPASVFLYLLGLSEAVNYKGSKVNDK